MRLLTKDWYLKKKFTVLFNRLELCLEREIRRKDFFHEKLQERYNEFVKGVTDSCDQTENAQISEKNLQKKFKAMLQKNRKIFELYTDGIYLDRKHLDLLGIGYTSKKIKNKINVFNEKILEEISEIENSARERSLSVSEDIMLGITTESLEGCVIYDFSVNSDSDVALRFDAFEIDLIDAVINCKEKEINIIKAQTSTAKTTVLAAEFYREGKDIVLETLLENESATTISAPWYMTITCANVRFKSTL